jgi:uncharacterized protein HemY
MPLWLIVLILITSFILFYYLIRLIKYLLGLPQHWCNNLNNKRLSKIDAIDSQRLFTIIYQKPQNWQNILVALPQLEKKSWISK